MINFMKNGKQVLEIAPGSALAQACEDYLLFIANILIPAKRALEAKVDLNKVQLHEAYGANLIVAHSIDYLLAVRAADGIEESRTNLVQKFDEVYSVNGAYIRNRKMELIDALNNGLKHIRLDPKRYKEVEKHFGKISFGSLQEEDGKTICNLDTYRFDYCRVVLLPAFRALSSWELHGIEDVLEFARGDFSPAGVSCDFDMFDPDDPSTAIDRMIAHVSSSCENCGEPANDCQCEQYVIDGVQGRYAPLQSLSQGEFNELMNQISPSYSSS